MTTLTLTKIKLVNKGEYSNTATYSEGDIVTYQNTSFVYKSNTATTGAPLFLETYTGNITANVVNTSNVITVTFGGGFTTNTSLEPIVAGEHFIYSELFEPGTKIKSVNSKTGNTWTITLTEPTMHNWSSNANNVPVTVSARRVGNSVEKVINKKHWDSLSYGNNFRGTWALGTTYLEGDLVVRSENTYLCTSGHEGIDPLWDNTGVWEPFALGNHRKPYNRITNIISGSPYNWRGHPYVPNPNWGTANTYTGIPWTLSESVKNNVHAPMWNENQPRGACVYRGEASFVDGDGSIIGHGGNGNYGFPTYTAHVGEIGAQQIWDWYADTPSHRQIGGKRPFTDFQTPPKVMQYAQGWNNRMSLLSNGQLCYQGDNGTGQSGYGNTTDTSPFRAQYTIDSRFFDGRKIVKISCPKNIRTGGIHYVLLDEFGEVWTGGYNAYWNLGDVADNHSPTANTNILATIASASATYTYHKLNKEIKFNGKRIVDISCGMTFNVALDEDGDLWTWGYNNYGQLGYPTTDTGLFSNTSYSKSPYKIPVDWASYGGIQKFMAFAGDTSHPMLFVLDGQGHIWNCGRNNIGQLGRGNTTEDSNASSITRTSSTAGWTIGGDISNFWLTGGDGGSVNAWFLTTGNVLWGVGYNGHRQLSVNSTTNQSLPVKALGPKGDMVNVVTVTSTHGPGGGTTQFALDTEGVAYAAGWNGLASAGVGHASYLDLTTGVTRNAQFGQAAGASWQRTFFPNTMHKKIVDISAFGDYEATLGYGHSEYTYWVTDEGEIVQTGESTPASVRTYPHTLTYIPFTPHLF